MGVQWDFDDKLTFLEVESDASDAGSSSFEYLTSATHSTHISMRRCNPDMSEDVRIFSTEEPQVGDARDYPLFSQLTSFWDHVTTAVAPRPLIYIYICSLRFCEGEGWKGSGRQGLLRPAATRPHQ